MKNTRPAETPFSWKPWLPAALVLFITGFSLYAISSTFDYALDDKIVVQDNKFVKQGFGGIKKILSTESFTGFLGQQENLVAGARYRPLSLVTFAIEHQFFGDSTFIHHLVNVLLYALTGIVLLRLLLMLFPVHDPKQIWLSVPFLAPLLFMLHPVHVEVVANIKGRDEILALLFPLLATIAALRFDEGRNPLQLLLASLWFFLGLMSKENALAFAVIIPATLWFFRKRNLNELVLIAGCLFIVSFLFVMIRTSVIGFLFSSGNEITSLMNNPFVDASVSQKFGTIFYTLILYLKLLFFPHPLTHDYYPYQIPLIGLGDLRALVPMLVYAGLAAVAVWGFKSRSLHSWAILFYLSALILVSNLLFPVGTFMNDRFLYMPSVAFCVWLAWLLAQKIPSRFPSIPSVLPVAALVPMIGFFSYKTFVRVPDWENDFTLTKSAISISVNSGRANQYYGYELYRKAIEEKDTARQRALYSEAEPYVDKALSIWPKYNDALRTKAGILAGFYQLGGPAKNFLDGILPLFKANYDPFYDEYLQYMNRMKRDVPDLVAFYHKLGYDFYLKEKKNPAEALKYLAYAEQLSNTDLQITLDLIEVFWAQKNYEKTALACQKCVGLDPKVKMCYEYGSKAFYAKGDSVNGKVWENAAKGM